MTIGNRLRQRRLSLGYTLDKVRNLMLKEGNTISKAALSKYELDKSIPKATNLYYLSRVLHASSDYFLKETKFEINWIAFRKTSKLTKTEENRIKFIAKEQVEAHLFLSNIIEDKPRKVVLPKYEVRSLTEADDAAVKLRDEWEMNNWPIESVTRLLEEKSVFIVDIASEKGFDGLSGKINGELPLIITTGHKSIDRKRLNIAHELGHLILDINNVDKEKAAFRFAASLLMPQNSIKDILGEKRRNIDIRELILLKEEYGISIQALIRRCYDLKIISENEYRKLNIFMRSHRMHINEPGNCIHKEMPTIIRSKLLRVISEGLTTESEVYGRFPSLSSDVEGEKMLMNWMKNSENTKISILEESARKLAEEYMNGGLLADLDIYDDFLEVK